jgi:hypothetical protein
MASRTSAALQALAAASVLASGPALAQGCRAREIMTSQCVWFALEDLGGNEQARVDAEWEATSTLVAGCSAGQYQMVLLRGTGLSDPVVARARARGTRDAGTVRAECAAEAGRVAAR